MENSTPPIILPTSVASCIEQMSKEAAEITKQAQLTIWNYWFDKKEWDYRAAIRLVCCGARGCIERCIEECENPFVPSENIQCFLYERDNQYINNLDKCLELYKADGLPDKITPNKFVKWVQTKHNIFFPEEILNIYTPFKQGGSKPETNKKKATRATCKTVEQSMITTPGNYGNKISLDIFLDAVKTSMESEGKGPLFQPAAASDFYRKSTALEPLKRKRGRPRNQ